MGILPKILNDNNYTPEKDKEIKKENGTDTYIIDFKNKKMIYRNGKQISNDLELATKMYIEKLLMTTMNSWTYHKNYGTLHSKVKGFKYDKNVYKVLIISNLKVQLLKWENISNVNDIEIKQDYNILNISFTITLKNGKKFSWERGYEI